MMNTRSYMRAFAGLGGGSLSLATRMLAGETDGVAIDFTDMSMVIKDTATPANNFSGNPNSKLVYTSPPTRYAQDDTGVFTSSTALRSCFVNGVNFGVELEPAATNLAFRSATPIGFWATSNTTASASSRPALFQGGAPADVTGNAGTLSKRYNPNATAKTAASVYTVSAYVEHTPGQQQFIQLADNGSNGYFANFDISNGTVGTNGANTTAATITPVATNIYRIRCTFNGVGAYNATQLVMVDSSSATWYASSASVLSFTVHHMQIELGSFPSSPIVTSATSATRAVDSLSLPDTVFNLSDTTHTLFIEIESPQPGSATYDVVITRAADSTQYGHYGTTAHSFTAYDPALGADGPHPGTTTRAAGTFYKLAGAYALNDFAWTQGGLAPSTDATGGMTPTDTLWLSNVKSGTSAIKRIRRILYLPRRANNAFLQTITT